MVLTFRYRVKNARGLLDKSRAVNQVWNYCGDVQEQARRGNRHWPTRFDLAKLVAGSTKMLGLHSDTIQDVCKHFVRSRDAKRRRPRWRKSTGSKRSLGWIPFQSARAIQLDKGGVTYLRHRHRLWLHRPIEGAVLCGSFSEDARGRWYLNLQCDVQPSTDCGVGAVGIDLGLTTFATLSTGERIENPRHYRREEAALATAQRAGRTCRAKAIHAKIKNRRRHDLHLASIRLVDRFETIVVGNVNAASLAKTRMAKSVLDAGWSEFRGQLRYKAMRHGATYIEADERFSTQTCSACGIRSGPKGLKGLGVREWECSCGVVHDRDVNAAWNILLSGQNVDLHQTESTAPLGR